MSDNVPRLTGGILFGLILEARKPRKRLRSTKLNGVETDKSDGLNSSLKSGVPVWKMCGICHIIFDI